MTLQPATFDGEGWLIAEATEGPGNHGFEVCDGFRVRGFGGGVGDVVVLIEGVDTNRATALCGGLALALTIDELDELIDRLAGIRAEVTA